MARQQRAAARPAAVSAARIADGIVEAGWLLAVALVPVFFNIHSGRPFEPDKTALLRILALLIGAASLGRLVEERLAPAPKTEGPPLRLRETPLFACALVYLAAAALSTVFSIDPALSLWGSHSRLEGLVTLLAHLTVFAAVATRLRRREQVDRLLDVMVAASVPVCVYGFVQRLGADPLDWKVPYQEWRISTTLGNPIFAGEYLAIVLPVTLSGLLWWWTRRGEAGRTARLAVYAAAAALQVVALGLTGSRGPWLGAATALAGLALLPAAVQGRRRLAGATLALGIAAIAFVGVLNIPGGPLERLRGGTVLGRLAHLFDHREDRSAGDRARVLVWQGSLRLAHLPAPIVVPGRGPDSAAAVRGVVGFGPETLQGVFGVVYDPAFAEAERRNPDVSAEGASTFSTRVPDRSHNEVLDSLVFGGAIGLLAYLLLHAAAQYTGLRALGLAETRKQVLLLAACCAGAGAILAVSAGLALSWAYLGVALPLGLVAGWAAFLLVAALRGRQAAPAPDAPLLAGITAALLGSFVSMQFGPAVVTGRLYFWTLAGLLLAAKHLAPRAEPSGGTAWGWDAARIAGPAVAFGFVIVYGFSGLKGSGGGRAAYGTMALLAGAAIAAWTVVAARRRAMGAYAAGVAAVLASLYALVHLRALAATAQVTSMPELYAALEGHFSLLALLAMSAAVALGLALGHVPGERPSPAGLLRLGGLIALALTLLVPRIVAGVNADVLRRFGTTFQAQGRLAEAVALMEEATRLAPRDAAHFQALGEAMLAATRLKDAPPRMPALLKQAEVAFQRAQALDPLGADHAANRARLERRRSEVEKDPAAARRHAEEAARLYAEVVALVPANTMLLNETAELDYQRLGDFTSAEGKLQRSRQLDPRFDYTLVALGDLYMARGYAKGSRDDFRLASAAFQEAIAIRRSLKAQVGLAYAYKEMGDTAAAIRAFEEALQVPPPLSTSWTLHEQLSALYQAQGNLAQARLHAAQALAQAPAPQKGPLEVRLRAASLIDGS